MGHAGSKITAPINTDDVSAVLGVSSHDVAYLCSNRHNKTNKWSKYKPVRIDSPTQKHLTATADQWYKGDDGKCGFILPIGAPGANGPTVANLYKTGAWAYRAPSPYIYNSDGTVASGLGEWCRLEDFIGYNHNAKPFLFSGIKKDTEYEVNLQIVKSVELMLRHETSDGSLSIEDFNDLALDYKSKMVLYLYKVDPLVTTSPALLRSYVSANTIEGSTNKSPSVTVTFDKTDLQNHGDYFWGLICLIGTSAGSAVMPIPYDNDNYFMVKFHLVDKNALSATLISLTGGRGLSSSNPLIGTTGDVSFALRFNNQYSSAVVVGDTALGARFQLRAEIGFGIGNINLTGGTITVPAGSTTYQGTFTASGMLKKIWDTFRADVTSTSVSVRITARDTTGATQSWQQLFPQFTIYLRRS